MSELLVRYVVRIQPVTKKNHQRILYKHVRRTGRVEKVPFIAPSAAYEAYQRDAGWFLRPAPREPINRPVEVVCRFYRRTRGRMDLTNAQEAIDDILVKHGILADDNCDVIVSHDGSRVLYDKDNPRTEIEIYAYSEEKV